MILTDLALASRSIYEFKRDPETRRVKQSPPSPSVPLPQEREGAESLVRGLWADRGYTNRRRVRGRGLHRLNHYPTSANDLIL